MDCNVDIISGSLRSMESIINRQAAVMNSGIVGHLSCYRFCAYLYGLAVVNTVVFFLNFAIAHRSNGTTEARILGWIFLV